jgi:hypothetical protein
MKQFGMFAILKVAYFISDLGIRVSDLTAAVSYMGNLAKIVL